MIPAFEFLQDVGDFYPENKTVLIQHWRKQLDKIHWILPFDM